MKQITAWDLPDTKYIQDGFHSKEVPDATSRNIEFLIKKINELAQEVADIEERLCGNNIFHQD